MDYLIHHMLCTRVNRAPEKEALVHNSERLTYREVARRVGGLAIGLKDAGLRRGDRMGIYLDPCVPQVLSIFSVSQAGGVFVPINQLLFPDQVAHVANDCKMRGLITTRAKLGSLAPVLNAIPYLEFVVVVEDGEAQSGPIALHSFEEMCSE